jgi:hypothetical protein
VLLKSVNLLCFAELPVFLRVAELRRRRVSGFPPRSPHAYCLPYENHLAAVVITILMAPTSKFEEARNFAGAN